MDDAKKSRGRVRTEVGAKRLRAFLDGQVVVDTVRPLFVCEAPYYPTYYVPAADVVATWMASPPHRSRLRDCWRVG